MESLAHGSLQETAWGWGGPGPGREVLTGLVLCCGLH